MRLSYIGTWLVALTLAGTTVSGCAVEDEHSVENAEFQQQDQNTTLLAHELIERDGTHLEGSKTQKWAIGDALLRTGDFHGKVTPKRIWMKNIRLTLDYTEVQPWGMVYQIINMEFMQGSEARAYYQGIGWRDLTWKEWKRNGAYRDGGVAWAIFEDYNGDEVWVEYMMQVGVGHIEAWLQRVSIRRGDNPNYYDYLLNRQGKVTGAGTVTFYNRQQ